MTWIPWAISPEGPDPTVFVGAGDPNDPAAHVDAAWPKIRLGIEGMRTIAVGSVLFAHAGV